MFAEASLLGFVAAALVVLLIPGPGVLYVVARSLSQGAHAGVVSAAGLSAGVLAHVLAAAVGLSALLLSSAIAFAVVKALGAGYLIYLGVRALLRREHSTTHQVNSACSSVHLFKAGVAVSVFNPKIAVFFLAFLPQFVDPNRGNVTGQVLMLGVLYALLAFVTDSAYAVVASRARYLMGGRFVQGMAPRYVSAVVYIGLGVSALFSRRLAP